MFLVEPEIADRKQKSAWFTFLTTLFGITAPSSQLVLFDLNKIWYIYRMISNVRMISIGQGEDLKNTKNLSSKKRVGAYSYIHYLWGNIDCITI